MQRGGLGSYGQQNQQRHGGHQHGPFNKPENALKRYNELTPDSAREDKVSVLQRMSATISNRRFRSYLHGGTIQLDLMTRFAMLCIDIPDLRALREGVYAYRSIVQCSHPHLLAQVLRTALDAAMQDLPDSECLHVYKMLTDLVKTTPRLEVFYHTAIRESSLLCVSRKKTIELHRVCDSARSHRNIMLKVRNEPERINMLATGNHLTTRVVQLQCAVKLELWRLAYEIAEDCVELGIHESPPGTGPQVRQWMGLYHDYLTQIAELFLKGMDMLNHSLALLRLYTHCSQRKTWQESPGEPPCPPKRLLADRLILAVASIDSKRSFIRPAACTSKVLGHGTTMSQTTLLYEVARNNIQEVCSAPATQIFEIQRGGKADLGICRLMGSMISALEEEYRELNTADHEAEGVLGDAATHTDPLDQLKPYFCQVRLCAASRLIHVIRIVYESVSIPYIANELIGQAFMPWEEVEALILDMCDSGTLNALFNVQCQYISFSGNEFLNKALCRIAKSTDDTLATLSGVTLDERSNAQLFNADSMRMLDQDAYDHMQDTLETNVIEERIYQERDEDATCRDNKRREAEAVLEAERQKAAEAAELKRKFETAMRTQRSEIASRIISEVKRQLPGEGAKAPSVNSISLDKLKVDDILEGRVNRADIQEAISGANNSQVRGVKKARENEEKMLNWTVRAVREESAAAFKKASEGRTRAMEAHCESMVRRQIDKDEEERNLLIVSHKAVMEFTALKDAIEDIIPVAINMHRTEQKSEYNDLKGVFLKDLRDQEAKKCRGQRALK